MVLTVNRVQDTNIIESRLDGEVREKDIENLRSEMDAVIGERGKLKLLFIYEGIGGTDPQTIWKDLKLEVRVINDIEKMAVVSEKGWFGDLAGLLDSVMSMEVETFEIGRREQALRWLKA